MKIIRPYSRLLVPWALEERNKSLITARAMGFIEWCGRISHRSEEAQTDGSWRRFIQNVVLDHGDWSIVEHVTASVDSITDRGITHESVRHRLFSFTQESTRFVNYEKKMPPAFIYPQVDVECSLCLSWVPIHCVPDHQLWSHLNDPCQYDYNWLCAIANAEQEYKNLLAKKWRPQEARSVLPNALASRIVTTGNLRNWRHLFIMRTTGEAHPQMRQVTIPLLNEFKEAFPLIFDDIEPNSRQVENLRKPR
jgi:thymidylate synthase (FAD)